MSGWQDREAYFKEHGEHPVDPYVERSACGCKTVWPDAMGGYGFKCDYHDAIDRHQMRELQKRRYAAAGVTRP